MNRKKKILYIIVNIFLPLLLGAILYFLFCPSVWFVKVFYSVLEVNVNIDLNILDRVFVRFLRNYLFDFLWAYALTSSVRLFVTKREHAFLCVLVAVCLGSVMELFQLWNLAYGTFDFWDIAIECLGSITAIVINTRRIYK